MQGLTGGFDRPLLSALMTAGLLACAAGPDAKMAPAGDEKDQESTEAAAAPASEPPAAEQPEGEWLVDDKGMEYRVRELVKGIDVRDFVWIDENRIQVNYGLQFDVLRHDDRAFYVKQYKRAAPAPGPTQEELERARREEEERLAAVAATYEVDLETVDRLRFEPFDRGLPRRGQWRNGFDIADMNGDGQLDIVFGPPRKSFPASPNIFLGDGRGGWRDWRQARFPQFPYDYGAAAAADVNGDGHMDLALGIHLRGLLVLVGDGAGGFEGWSEGIALESKGGSGTVFSSRAVALVDWNGDQRPDLLALGEGPQGIKEAAFGDSLKAAYGPIVFVNEGDGTWRPTGAQAPVFGDSLALGDFDGDGRLDFATASLSAGSRSIVNLGRGSEEWETRAVAALRPSSFVRAVASGRLDGDTRDDLVVGYLSNEGGVWRTGVDVLYAGPDLEWRHRPLFVTEGKAAIYSVATGDVDGDGRLDIALATGNGEVAVFLAEESGFFAREVSPEFPESVRGCRGYGLRLSDLDGDGRAELIAAFAGESAGLPPSFGTNQGCPQGGSLRAWSPKEP